MRSYTTKRMVELSGCGFRQLDYWARIGLLKPSVQQANGSGSQRRYSEADERLARVLGLLSPGRQQGGDTGGRRASHLRHLVAATFRENPDARFYVLADGSYVVACGTAEEVVALTNQATVLLVIQPDQSTG